MQRRDWLRRLLGASLAGGVSAVLAQSLTQAQRPPRWSHDPFSLGVASGSPRHDSVVLWTRLLGPSNGLLALTDDVAVRWQVAEDAQFQRIVREGEAPALAALAHSVHVEVDGLPSNRWLHYRFESAGATSAVGRTRTMPAPGESVAALRLAFASCQNWEQGYFSAYRHMRDDRPDLVLFLGDYIYEYPGGPKAFRRAGYWTITLDDYLRRYTLNRAEPELMAMHAAAPWAVTWDDHEVQNDYAGLNPGDSGPALPEGMSFAQRRAAAYQAWFEHMPLRWSQLVEGLGGLARGAEMRLYGTVPLGALGQVHLLDGRQYKDAIACTPWGRGSATVKPETCAIWNDPSRSMLGAAQEQWLAAQFAARPGGWTFVAQATLLGPRDFRQGPGQAFWNDGWDGYPAARQRLIDSWRQPGVKDVVVLGGDVHENYVGHILADFTQPDSEKVAVEFCGTSVTSRSGDAEKIAGWLRRNPHFVYADGREKGYGLVEVSAERLRTTLRVVDNVFERETGVRTLAVFEVQRGKSEVRRTDAT